MELTAFARLCPQKRFQYGDVSVAWLQFCFFVHPLGVVLYSVRSFQGIAPLQSSNWLRLVSPEHPGAASGLPTMHNKLLSLKCKVY
jgi:hypothetical protein